MTLRIATRRSALALAQARSVAEALGGAELVEVVTAGDRGERGGDKSRWVAELERKLLDGEADLAVHSAKDVPGELASGLAIVAVPPRADPRDALCGATSLEELGPGARVGTSSLRRSSQLRAVRDDLELMALRGNVDTRLRRLAAGELDALVLAVAGLQRLGRAGEAGCALDPDRFVPAPGQGALALEARGDDQAVVDGLAALDDPAAHACLRAERALTARLEATCHTPVGAHATALGDGRLRLTAYVGLPDGSAWVRDRLEGTIDGSEELGRTVGDRVLAAGGQRLLEAVG
ncbi:MAG TPA: hydroxymethylbilane synthase [Solirubrobacteraceae bacterium]|nr:hydroxymethylbilane synthase [Solirubrobacteraceae bacterium]